MRALQNETICLEISGDVGQAALAVLEDRLGSPCGYQVDDGQPVWAEGGGARMFAGRPDVRFDGVLQLGPGLRVHHGREPISPPTLRGPGAEFWALQQSTLVGRQNALPPLPAAWAEAINQAAAGETVL
jgi:hypothetical protein